MMCTTKKPIIQLYKQVHLVELAAASDLAAASPSNKAHKGLFNFPTVNTMGTGHLLVACRIVPAFPPIGTDSRLLGLTMTVRTSVADPWMHCHFCTTIHSLGLGRPIATHLINIHLISFALIEHDWAGHDIKSE